MRRFPVICAAIFITASSLAGTPLLAQTQTLSARQIQDQIDSGQEVTALSELNVVLQAHPHSGPAWYLTAEAQDAAGNEPAARAALANAQAYAPGLPFAQPGKVAELQSHLNASPSNSAPAAAYAPAPAHHGSFVPVLILLAVGFFVIRMFLRRRRYAPTAYPPANQAYGPGGMPYGPSGGMGGGMGGGIGSGLLGGLAAGAGFAAGERVIDDVMGNHNQNIDQTSFNPPNIDPGPQDDGLSGNPGWDDNSGGDGIDSGTSW